MFLSEFIESTTDGFIGRFQILSS